LDFQGYNLTHAFEVTSLSPFLLMYYFAALQQLVETLPNAKVAVQRVMLRASLPLDINSCFTLLLDQLLRFCFRHVYHYFSHKLSVRFHA